MPPTTASAASTAIGATSSAGTGCAAASRARPVNSPSQKRPMYANVSAAASTAITCTTAPGLARGGEEQLVLEEPDRQRQRGQRRRRDPARDRQRPAARAPGRRGATAASRPVATVTAPAVMNSALLAIACAITYSAAAPERRGAADPVQRDDVPVLGDRRVGEDLLELVLRQRQHAADRDRREARPRAGRRARRR